MSPRDQPRRRPMNSPRFTPQPEWGEPGFGGKRASPGRAVPSPTTRHGRGCAGASADVNDGSGVASVPPSAAGTSPRPRSGTDGNTGGRTTMRSSSCSTAHRHSCRSAGGAFSDHRHSCGSAGGAFSDHRGCAGMDVTTATPRWLQPTTWVAAAGGVADSLRARLTSGGRCGFGLRLASR
jgi:hypothetical protein